MKILYFDKFLKFDENMLNEHINNMLIKITTKLSKQTFSYLLVQTCLKEQNERLHIENTLKQFIIWLQDVILTEFIYMKHNHISCPLL